MSGPFDPRLTAAKWLAAAGHEAKEIASKCHLSMRDANKFVAEAKQVKAEAKRS